MRGTRSIETKGRSWRRHFLVSMKILGNLIKLDPGGQISIEVMERLNVKRLAGLEALQSFEKENPTVQRLVMVSEAGGSRKCPKKRFMGIAWKTNNDLLNSEMKLVIFCGILVEEEALKMPLKVPVDVSECFEKSK